MRCDGLGGAIVFPACAGMSRLRPDELHPGNGVPHIRGDEPPSTRERSCSVCIDYAAVVFVGFRWWVWIRICCWKPWKAPVAFVECFGGPACVFHLPC